MITQIEIDGFKTFKDFKVELAPFQVIVGANGSGKSNLFDALHLLSRLAFLDIPVAFQQIRGEVGELFTALPDGQRTNRMRLAVELLVNREVSGGGEAPQIETEQTPGTEPSKRSRLDIPLQYTRLRYELEIVLDSDQLNLNRLHIVHESLKSIPEDEDRWSKKYGILPGSGWLLTPMPEQKIFINTQFADVSFVENSKGQHATIQQPLIYLYPDSVQRERIRRFYANEVQQTVLSRVTDIEHPHILAVQEELSSFRFLHLNTEMLRESSSTIGSSFISSEGKGLARMLARIQAEDEVAMASISLDMANLVPGVLDIRVEQDKASDKYVIFANTSDDRSFSSRVLSDGTLRLLALATIKNSSLFRGTLCLEEPENGVHPQRLKKLALLLRVMATDFSDAEQVDEPLRQVLITTHSPAFISLPEIIDSLLFSYTMTSVEPVSSGKPTLEITCMTPVITPLTQARLDSYPDKDETMEVFTLDEVLRYLKNENFDPAREQLRQARTTLNKG